MSDAFADMAAAAADEADRQLRQVRDGLRLLAASLEAELERDKLAPNERRHTLLTVAFLQHLIALADS